MHNSNSKIMVMVVALSSASKINRIIFHRILLYCQSIPKDGNFLAKRTGLTCSITIFRFYATGEYWQIQTLDQAHLYSQDKFCEFMLLAMEL